MTSKWSAVVFFVFILFAAAMYTFSGDFERAVVNLLGLIALLELSREVRSVR